MILKYDKPLDFGGPCVQTNSSYKYMIQYYTFSYTHYVIPHENVEICVDMFRLRWITLKDVNVERSWIFFSRSMMGYEILPDGKLLGDSPRQGTRLALIPSGTLHHLYQIFPARNLHSKTWFPLEQWNTPHFYINIIQYLYTWFSHCSKHNPISMGFSSHHQR